MADNQDTRESTADGFIYIDPSDIPASNTVQLGDLDAEHGASHQVAFEEDWSTQTGGRTVWSRRLKDWVDPLTPPQTRTECVKYAQVGPIKTCVGWKTQTRTMRNTATVIVSLSTPADIKKDIDDCVKTAAVVAAIAALKSGGAAAIAALEKTFFACMKAKLGSNLVSVKVSITSRWSGWS